MPFTEQQLQDWERFEKVRSSNRYNMITPQARQATGLNDDRYMFVLNNYANLRTQFQREKQ